MASCCSPLEAQGWQAVPLLTTAAAHHRRSTYRFRIPSPPQAAGAEFFRRRLQRATAIPPEQRDPAVHAFATSVQLMEAADELLPLTADGQPALPPHTRAGQQAEVQALLLTAMALHAAPEMLEWEGRHQARLGCYWNRRMALAGGSWEAAYLPALQPLGGLLLKVLFAQFPAQSETSFELASLAARQAQSARGAISRQLQQLQRSSEQQLLTAEQLEAVLHYLAINNSQYYVDMAGHQGTLPEVPKAVVDAVVASSERLLVLEPHSPNALPVQCIWQSQASHTTQSAAPTPAPAAQSCLQRSAG